MGKYKNGETILLFGDKYRVMKRGENSFLQGLTVIQTTVFSKLGVSPKEWMSDHHIPCVSEHKFFPEVTEDTLDTVIDYLRKDVLQHRTAHKDYKYNSDTVVRLGDNEYKPQRTGIDGGFLSGVGCVNDQAFKDLEIEPIDFIISLGLKPHGGVFPEVDAEQLDYVIDTLKQKFLEKEQKDFVKEDFDVKVKDAVESTIPDLKVNLFRSENEDYIKWLVDHYKKLILNPFPAYEKGTPKKELTLPKKHSHNIKL